MMSSGSIRGSASTGADRLEVVRLDDGTPIGIVSGAYVPVRERRRRRRAARRTGSQTARRASPCGSSCADGMACPLAEDAPGAHGQGRPARRECCTDFPCCPCD